MKSNYFSYSASENNEIKKIREKYEFDQKEPSKLDRLRKLDGSVNRIACTAALSAGIIGILIFGFGLSCVLMRFSTRYLLGIITGIIGIAVAAAAYPIYRAVSEKRRKKIAPIILELTDELMK